MSKKNVVENTSAESRRDPLGTFAEHAFGGPMSIERSEKRGQEQLVASHVLPTEIQDLYEPDKPIVKGSGKALLEKWGFVFGKVVGGDTLFQHAQLPAGWSKQGTDHDMWSKVLDEQDRERCAIFYKAAFYDRNAHLHITPRYQCDRDYKLEGKGRLDGPCRGVVREGDKVLFEGPWREDAKPGSFQAYEQAGKDAAEWFKANLPQSIEQQWATP